MAIKFHFYCNNQDDKINNPLFKILSSGIKLY